MGVFLVFHEGDLENLVYMQIFIDLRMIKFAVYAIILELYRMMFQYV